VESTDPKTMAKWERRWGSWSTDMDIGRVTLVGWHYKGGLCVRVSFMFILDKCRDIYK